MVADGGIDAVEVLAAHRRDPAGLGVQALAEALVASGLGGIEISPELGFVSHRAGRLDADDVAAAVSAGVAVQWSPAARRDLIEPVLPIISIALLTASSLDHTLAKSTSQAVSIRRGDGSVVATSSAWGELTGRSDLVYDGEHPTVGIDPAYQHRVARMLELLRERGETIEEWVFTRPDGSTVSVRSSVRASHWPSGEIRSIVTHNEDLTKLRELEARLSQGELFQDTLERSPYPLSVRDGELRLVWANQAYLDLVGRSYDELLGTVPDDLTVAEDFDAAARSEVLGQDRDRNDFQEIRYCLPDGGTRRVRLQSARVRLASGEVRFVSFVEDLTERDQRDAEFNLLRRRLGTMLEHTPGVLSIYDTDLNVVFSNDGRSQGKNLHDLVQADQVDVEVIDRVATILSEGQTDRWHTWVFDEVPSWFEVSAAPVLDELGRPEGVVTIGIDRTEQLAVERQLAHQAVHDDLTGLLDRAGLMKGLAEIADTPESYAVLFIDLDSFKNTNDTLGHEIGDQLLTTVARRLRAAAGPTCLIGRAGGDEFLVAVATSASEANALASALMRSIRSPVELDGAVLHPTVSIGVAHVAAGTTPHEAIRRSDVAMYEAKRRGRNRSVEFDDDMAQRIAHRRGIEEGIRRALVEDQLELHYQPEYDLATGRLLGAEALLRWNDPTSGRLVSAGEFIEIAEETGLIGELGRFVARRAAQDAADWPTDLMVRLNLSARQLEEPDLVDFYLGEFARVGLPTRRVCVELTETAIASPDSLHVIHELSAAGCTIALDDFGTGFSSMSMLRTLPVDVIKIDRSFVDGLGTEPGDTVLVRSIVALAQSFGHDVVAEGVENATHVEELLALGCRRAQGFGLDRPLPLTELRSRFGGPAPALLRHETEAARLIP